mmetsp:Transcript_1715/g.4816  ORF Transcript_1715/g.4816 Transcript_1715/m.4816 type:complete len:232 (+) Transcript_1715:59-754(+)|eukprot:CAMPEP_0115855594 /NCGR_PEP_ID=MMETSP0287-20121206/14622_1 /TAXON_ID=412157 /ORGANISM="Chrysochromulina rotalis, Strain UIO044" /LENGTH=231 /DNA_ID=CAMNT_0003309751 /DNA_START=59 /DNA_END=754 /DNA_ORIENTATION=+
MSSAPRAVYFLGLELPQEARLSLRIIPTLDSIKPLVEAVMAYIEGSDADSGKRLQKSMSLDSTTFSTLFTGVHWFLRVCMRSSLKPMQLSAELADIKMPDACVEPLVFAVQQGRARQTAGETAVASTLPTLDALRWRLDVTISTSSLHRVLRPALTMQTTLSDGSVHAFHVPKQRFNELRYTAAKLLKEMQTLDARMPSIDVADGPSAKQQLKAAGAAVKLAMAASMFSKK